MKHCKHLLALFVTSLVAIPIDAQTFENVFQQNPYNLGLPQFYDDVDGDGKLEYFLSGSSAQWRSIDGRIVKDLESLDMGGVSAWQYNQQQLNAEPYLGFASIDKRFQASPGWLFIPYDGSYIYRNVNMENTTGLTWADVNLDGLADMLYWDNSDGIYRPYFNFQQKNGSFLTQPVPIVTDEEELKSLEYSQGGNGSFTIRGNAFGGFSNPDKNYYSKSPMTVVDLNLDGYPDFIDEKGNSLISLGKGKYYQANFAGKVETADVNGDGLTDLIIYSNGELTLKLNTGKGFTDTSLLKNNAVKGVYVLDCDGDGLLDILVTIPSEENSFIAFLKNQGNGKFKRTVKTFTGYFNWSEPYFINNNGLPSLFSTRNLYVTPPGSTSEHVYNDALLTVWNWDSSFKVDTFSINRDTEYVMELPPRDIDGDGKVEFATYTLNDQRGIYRFAVDKANTAPKKMDAPSLILDKSNGMLRADWYAGQDAENASGDLSYEFEVSSDGEYLYRIYTKNLFALAAAGIWGKKSVSARVRAIDACGMKGEWSDYAQQNDISQLATFIADKKVMSTCDTVFVSSLNDKEFTLLGRPDGTIVKSDDGKQGVIFDTFGKKQVEGISADGLSFSLDVEVLPLRIEKVDAKGGTWFDFNQEGRLLSMRYDGLFAYENGKLVKQPVFGLSDGADKGVAVFDANMDGLPDILCVPGLYQTTQAIINQGDGEFEKSTIAYTYDGETMGNKSSDWVDFNNDGLLDFYDYEKLYYNNGDGTFTSQSIELNGYALEYLVVKSVADYDRDGRMDILATVKDNAKQKFTAVLFNDGNGKFTVSELNIQYSSDCVAYDVDGDGYMDIVYNNKTILKNLGNRTFASEQQLENRLVSLDLDLDGKADYQSNDGYSIIVSNNGNPITLDNEHQYYISGDSFWRGRYFADFNNDGTPDYVLAESMNLIKKKQENTPPTAPTTLYANQKDGEVIISWSGATDKESTNAQLLYNISIKKKGENGENSYIWSPLNGTNDKAKMTETTIMNNYRQATTLPMPISRFEAGKTYEICVQTLDPWMAHSPFSKVIEFTPSQTTLISLPEKTGVGQTVKAKIMSTVSGVALRTDDGEVKDDGTITWNTPGLKTVRAISTENTQVQSTAQIMVYAQPSLEATAPSKVLAGQTLVIDMPACLRNENVKASVTGDNAEVSYDANTNQTVMTIAEDATSCRLKISYTDDVWTKAITKTFDMEVIGAGWQPQLTQVSVSNGSNVLTWDAAQALPDASIFTGKVKVYRETNVSDSYELIGEANLSDGKFVDENCRPEVMSNRYQITLPTVYGVESAPSRVHASVHVMVNKGLGNDINLHWTPYEGADIAQYEVYAGTTPDNMQVVESLSGYARSYVHHRSSADVTYYAIGMKCKVDVGNSRATRSATSQNTLLSNVICSTEAYAVKVVTGIEILTTETDAVLSESQPMLHLQALVTPALATIGTVEWSIVEGGEFAAISKDGVLTAIFGSKVGSVIVQAKAIDGSEVVATKTFEVPMSTAISSIPADASDVVIASGNGYISVKANNGSLLITNTSGAIVYRSTLTGERKISLPSGIYIVKVGKVVKKLVVR